MTRHSRRAVTFVSPRALAVGISPVFFLFLFCAFFSASVSDTFYATKRVEYMHMHAEFAESCTMFAEGTLAPECFSFSFASVKKKKKYLRNKRSLVRALARKLSRTEHWFQAAGTEVAALRHSFALSQARTGV